MSLHLTLQRLLPTALLLFSVTSVQENKSLNYSHGDKKVFSCHGLRLAVNWFWDKGLRDITVFVPLWRKEQTRPEAPITDQHILHELERRKILVYTPSRCVNGKRVVCYDDRYIIKLAVESDGIIVSNDNYRDLQTENPQWKKFIEERLLMYTFANDKFMPPDDPLGRNGPTIDDFLRKKPWTPENKQQQQHCPYGKKCTYGIKCKFYHPERVNQSQLAVADELRALAHQPEHRYTPPPPPLGSRDDLSHCDPSICHRENSILRSQLNKSPPFYQYYSSDGDEAFSSMGSSMSRLSIQDMSYGDLLTSYSSGRGSYQMSGSYAGNSLRLSPSGHNCYPPQNGSVSRECHMCSQCGCGHQKIRMPANHHHHHQPVWSSCPALPPHNREQSVPFSDEQYNRLASPRQSHSLPQDSWVQPSLCVNKANSQASNLSNEQRNDLRSRLSTLFPQSMVEQVLNANPHVSDMLELISLIQNYRTSNISF